MGFNKITWLSIVGFFTACSAALVDTIWAVYLDSFLGNIAYVGFISGLFTFVGFFSFLAIVPIIERNKKSSLYLLSLIIFVLSYLLFAFIDNLILVIFLGIVLAIFSALRWTSFGIILRDISSNKNLSGNEGMVYSFSNLAWTITPLFAGYLSEFFGISFVFIFASFFAFASFILFKFSGIHNSNIKKKVDGNIFRNFLDYFKDKERVIAYVVSGGISFWWMLIFIYTPLFIERSGLHLRWIGYFLFAVGLPLVLSEYFFSKFTKNGKFRNIFVLGYFILSVCAFSSFFVSNIYFILGILAFGSFGAAMLEPTTEAYFFTILKNKSEETQFYGPYNTTIDLFVFLGKIVPAVFLLFFSFNHLFLVFGVVMFALAAFSSKVRK